MGIIYCASNLITGKSYIGQTTLTLEKRKAKHLQNSQTDLDSRFYQAIRKHGIDSFEWEIVEEVETENLDEREIYWINEFNTLFEGYNMTIGGGTIKGYSHSDETKEKIKKSLGGKSMRDHYIKNHGEEIGVKKYEEYIEKLNKANGKGRTRLDLFMERHGEEEGKRLYNEFIKKIKESRKGKDTWMKGKKHSDESKKIMSEKQTGPNNNNYAKKFSEDHRKKISDSRKKYWIRIRSQKKALI